MTAELLVRVLPHARVRAWPDTDEKPARDFAVLPVAEAFARVHTTDAHVVAYEGNLGGYGRKRLATAAIGRELHPRMVLGVVDWDDPTTHAENRERKRKGLRSLPATEAWRADSRARIAALRADAPGVVAYETRGGVRLVGLLPEQLVLSSEACVVAWRCRYVRLLARLSARYGIVADPSCIDWTRLYRLPRVKRDGGTGEDLPVWGDWRELGAWPEDLCPPPDAPGRSDDYAEARARGWPQAKHCAPVDELLGWSNAHQGGTAPARTTPASPGAGDAPRRASRRRSREVEEPTVAADLGAVSTLARRLAHELAAFPRGQGLRHHALLAVVGALVDAGWGDAALRRVGADLGALLGDAREELESAITSTRRACNDGRPYIARSYLLEHAPALAALLGDARAKPGERWRRALDRIKPALEHTPSDAAVRVRAMLADSRETRGVRVIAAPPGTGKTRACVAEACEAAARGGRTAYLAPSHVVARMVADELRAKGLRVAYLTSVLAHTDDDGETACRYAEGARALAAAGVAVEAVLCDGDGYAYREHITTSRARAAAVSREASGARVRLPVVASKHDPCGHREACGAYAAQQRAGDELAEAAVLVTVHALAGAAARWLGEQPDNALAVVDEGPELLEARRVTAAELAEAATAITADRSAVARSETWRGGLLRALAEGLARHTTDGHIAVSELLVAGLAVTELELGDAERRQRVETWQRQSIYRESSDGAPPRRRGQWAPRPSRAVVTATRKGHPPHAMLRAIHLAGLVSRALAAEAGEAPRTTTTTGMRDWGEGAGVRELRVSGVVGELAGLLVDPRWGRVVLDATVNPAALGAALGVEVEVERLAVRDGAPVERVFIPWSHSTRRHCLPDGAIDWTELAGPLAEGLAVAAEGLAAGDELAVFSWRTVAAALDAALADQAVVPTRVAEALTDLRRRGVRLVTGYYGATRGRDDWKGARALLAVGSPWPSVADMTQTCEAWGLVGGERDLARHQARAELEQACGRLRAPWRTRAGRIVVVAADPPLGADVRWSVRELAEGRPPAADHQALAEASRVLGVAAAAAAAGVSRATVQRARRGAQPVEQPVEQPVGAPRGGASQRGATDTSATGCDAPPRVPPPPRGPSDDPPPPAAAREACGGCSRAPPRARAGCR